MSLSFKYIFLDFLQVYRHGDRMPIEPYAKDPWKDIKYWPNDWGQLTNVSEKIEFINLQ